MSVPHFHGWSELLIGKAIFPLINDFHPSISLFLYNGCKIVILSSGLGLNLELKLKVSACVQKLLNECDQISANTLTFPTNVISYLSVWAINHSYNFIFPQTQFHISTKCNLTFPTNVISYFSIWAIDHWDCSITATLA